MESAVLKDIRESLKRSNIEVGDLCVPRGLEDVQSAIHDFDPDTEEKGQQAWRFLRGMANSKTFVENYWHQYPLLIRASDTGGWVEGSFTVEKELR